MKPDPEELARLKDFKENRDPILKMIYHSVEKTRKWVVFIGVMLILSIIVVMIS